MDPSMAARSWDVSAGFASESQDVGVELEFAGGGRVSLAECSGVRFEDAVPACSFRWSRGQGHFPGWWWLATTGRHVGYESWLERDHLMLLDFDPAVTAVASQPFWLHWHDSRRSRRSPRLCGGSGTSWRCCAACRRTHRREPGRAAHHHREHHPQAASTATHHRQPAPGRAAHSGTVEPAVPGPAHRRPRSPDPRPAAEIASPGPDPTSPVAARRPGTLPLFADGHRNLRG